MTQEKSEGAETSRVDGPADIYDPTQPRLGRRESEPHSEEVTYLHDVFKTNFPNGRVLWDLHHYFIYPKGVLEGKKMNLRFDISYFKDLDIPYSLSSYDSSLYGGKVPDIAINVLSKSTWSKDLSEIVEDCKDLSIPIYVVFSPYLVTSKRYAPPFLRVYILEKDQTYRYEELRDITLKEGGEINEKNIIDVSDRYSFRFGLMQLNQKHIGGKNLFRLILLDPSEPKILPTKNQMDILEVEKLVEEAQRNTEIAEKKAEELEKKLRSYREKFGNIE